MCVSLILQHVCSKDASGKLWPKLVFLILDQYFFSWLFSVPYVFFLKMVQHVFGEVPHPGELTVLTVILDYFSGR